MPEITLDQMYALLQKLEKYVINEVPMKRDVDERFAQVDQRLEQVDKRLEQVDKRFEQVNQRFARIEYRLEKIELEKADKKDIQLILNILDKQTKQLDIIRTEQVAFNHAFMRLEKRVEALER